MNPIDLIRRDAVILLLIFCIEAAGAAVSTCYVSARWKSPDHTKTDTQPFPLPGVPLQYFTDQLNLNISSFQYGTAQVPYTTAGAYGSKKQLDVAGFQTVSVSSPSDLRPWSAVGKLIWDSGALNSDTMLNYCQTEGVSKWGGWLLPQVGVLLL